MKISKRFSILLVIGLALVVVGCAPSSKPGLSPGVGGSERTVSLRGQVSIDEIGAAVSLQSTAESGAASMTMTLDEANTITEEIEVHLFRIAHDGERVLLKSGTTDERGRYAFTDVPDRTRVVVEARVEIEDSFVTLRSTVMIDGNTEQDINPRNHVVTEVTEHFFSDVLSVFQLELSAADLTALADDVAELFETRVMPEFGSPPELALWDEPTQCYFFDPMDESPTGAGEEWEMDDPGFSATNIQCYIFNSMMFIQEDPALIGKLYETIYPMIPVVAVGEVPRGKIHVDGDGRDWSGIRPFVVPNDMTPTLPFVTFDEHIERVYMVQDDELIFALVEYVQPLDNYEWAGLQFDLVGMIEEQEVRLWFPDLDAPEQRTAYAMIGEYSNDMEDWILSGDTPGFAWAAKDRFVELSFPRSWVTEQFSVEPILVVHSTAGVPSQCEEHEDGGGVRCSGDSHILPVQRVGSLL